MKIKLTVETPIERTFRVEQAAGMFDLKVAEKAKQEFSCELPDEQDEWTIGAIVGPSGSGKTTIARQAYGERLIGPAAWPAGLSVLDGFDEKFSIKHVTGVLTAVGFSSPPSWVKPYAVLSNGEKFRCDLARALLSDSPIIAFDEFTSVVDRTVAKVGSAAVARAVRKGKLAKRFVAVTCHYDVLEWLEADWVLDMASSRLDWRSLRRPSIEIEVAPIHRSAWVLFRRHHYLNTELSVQAKCFCAFWGGEPVAFSAWLWDHAQKKDFWREHRTVVLPDFQGIGIGNKVSEFCASIFRGLGKKVISTTSHPAMIGYRSASPLWDRQRLGMAPALGRSGKYGAKHAAGSSSCSSGRITGSFEFVGPALERSRAKSFMDAKPGLFALGENEKRVCEELKKYPGATANLIGRLAELTPSGTAKILERLTEAGLVAREGRGGGGGRQFSYRWEG
jgi:ABC-type thiamine transport system ATPase subunit